MDMPNFNTVSTARDVDGRLWLCRLQAPAALLVTLLLAQSVSAADDVHIWIRAFIPDVAGSSGDSYGTNVTGAALMRASDGGCIATDQRSWSDATGARSRLVSDFHLLVDTTGVQLQPSTGGQVTAASAIRSVDCTSGAEIGVLPAQLLADELQSPGQTDAAPTDNDARARVFAAVADPLRSWSSATIHYDATFTYNRQSRTLEYEAMTGAFPAYEAYATLNSGPVVTVFRSGPVRRGELPAGAKTDAASVELKGAVNLGDTGKRPKAPTNLTVQ